ncbi:hypothetical protein Q5752_006361 [Cryptotrichosporon argae]
MSATGTNSDETALRVAYLFAFYDPTENDKATVMLLADKLRIDQLTLANDFEEAVQALLDGMRDPFRPVKTFAESDQGERMAENATLTANVFDRASDVEQATRQAGSILVEGVGFRSFTVVPALPDMVEEQSSRVWAQAADQSTVADSTPASAVTGSPQSPLF